MTNPKQKKIKKQRQAQRDPVDVAEKEIEAEIDQNSQQVMENQNGLFSGMVEEGAEPEVVPISEENQKKLQKCQFGKAFLYKLELGHCYKIFNRTNGRAQVRIIDGGIDINGKKHSDSFFIKEDGSLIVMAFKSESKEGDRSRLIEIQSQRLQYLKDYDTNRNGLLWTQENIQIIDYQNRSPPWNGFDHEKFLKKGEVTMLLGLKNTGKSMLCQFLLNMAQKSNSGLCLLDIDIGKNIMCPGCVSLIILDNQKRRKSFSLWVGQYTPLNSIPNYIQAVKELFAFFKENYFTYSLIINTMGYLTGVGQLLIYEAFSIVKPHKILGIKSSDKQEWVLENIINCLKSGTYVERLHFAGQQSGKTSTRVERYTNEYAETKKSTERFEMLLTHFPLKSIEDLIQLIVSQRLVKVKKELQVYRKSNVAITQIQFGIKTSIEMRIILLGKFWRHGLFQVAGVGFGWDGSVYYDPELVSQSLIQLGVVSDGIDFERSFYQISETRLIQIQEFIGKRLPFIQPFFKVLGSKGVRNNPGKKMVPNN